ncbi:hypothetical protein [Bacillus sp. JCM 19034]|uniref:hypothetical protein n=1 Tax=Bacillus sp. JCM 19034 TaxID=1481928 RepID=UPI000782C75B|nr:hypothetical protein [Bacillus sp. JCM 19034]
MSHDPFEKEKFLVSKLNEYHVDIPDIALKPKRKIINRFLAFLASPTRNPFEQLIVSFNGVILLKVAPCFLL